MHIFLTEFFSPFVNFCKHLVSTVPSGKKSQILTFVFCEEVHPFVFSYPIVFI